MPRELETGSKFINGLLRKNLQAIIDDGECSVFLTKAEHEALGIELGKLRSFLSEAEGEAAKAIDGEDMQGLLHITAAGDKDGSKDNYIPFSCSVELLGRIQDKAADEACPLDEYQKAPSEEPGQGSSGGDIPDYESIGARGRAAGLKRWHIPRADYMDGVFTVKGIRCLTRISTCPSCTRRGWVCIKVADGEQIEKSTKCSKCIRHGKSGCDV